MSPVVVASVFECVVGPLERKWREEGRRVVVGDDCLCTMAFAAPTHTVRHETI